MAVAVWFCTGVLEFSVDNSVLVSGGLCIMEVFLTVNGFVSLFVAV